MLKCLAVFWPSFLTAILGEVLFFAFIDPQELYLLGHPVHWSPIAVYSVGFFLFWSLTALTAALTFFLSHPTANPGTPSPQKEGVKHPVAT